MDRCKKELSAKPKQQALTLLKKMINYLLNQGTARVKNMMDKVTSGRDIGFLLPTRFVKEPVFDAVHSCDISCNTYKFVNVLIPVPSLAEYRLPTSNH